MIRFILNNREINTDLPPGTLLLDFIRYQQHLMGTKIGCREGDCGACTVLTGEWKEGKLRYRSVTSCLTALGNVHMKHVVTVEGLNGERLNPAQEAICEEGGTQCGFCTPGFIVSMTGFCLSGQEPVYKHALAAVDGNICRCTGYKSIQRALGRVVTLMKEKDEKEESVDFLVVRDALPSYFVDIPQRLKLLSLQPDGVLLRQNKGAKFLGGGTDLYVQQHESMPHTELDFLFDRKGMKGIVQEGQHCLIGAAVTVTDLMESPIIRGAFPEFGRFASLVSSTPIRNIATLAGNFVNASPIGDFSVFFLALDARLVLSDGVSTRQLPLRDFYKGYKLLNKKPEEFIQRIEFEMPGKHSLFNFEKVSKRTWLDIASVNTAMCIRMDGNKIAGAHISAGGVAPVPAFLAGASAFLRGQILDEDLVLGAVEKARSEIVPITDARGTAAYKSLLLGQLIKAHFISLFPSMSVEKLLPGIPVRPGTN
ncbi:MAG TPA: FAD binding domain-containing protein [Puia sp.]|nr:FAD binding domain-containing protein [Puia sp.]